MKAILIWGTQLTIDHNSALNAALDAPVIIIESRGMSSRYKFHKQKLRFVLTAMREFAEELRLNGRTVWYSEMDKAELKWFDELKLVCEKHRVTELVAMRANDRPPQQNLEDWCLKNNIKLQITPNEMFLTSTADFHDWAEGQKRLQMEQFYRWQRERLNILIKDGKPEGGKWNFDAENRKPFPKDATPPNITFPKPSSHASNVEILIEKFFADHPGSLEINWLPTTRSDAKIWLKQFIDERFQSFGDYEDAMVPGETFLYHSALSALLNIGLLHASEVVDAAIKAKDVPLTGKEGFIRQIIGWREFMFGLYHFKPLEWKQSNFLEQDKKLPNWWYTFADAPEPPLVDALKRLHNYGYSHHIERLMVFGNYMLLSNYRPQAVYDWFMTMYVDAYEWVMVPNVIGMSQFADGGIDHGGFASKPYISGSNYLQKMGHWWPTAAAAQESDWTRLYWEFLKHNQATLSENYRMAPLLKRV